MSDEKRFFRYVIPSVGGMLVSALYFIVDGIFVGRGVGTVGLAAVNISIPFITILFAVTDMAVMGGATITSIRFGEGDKPGANRSFLVTLSAILVFSVFISLVAFFFAEELALFLGASEFLMQPTADYLRYYTGFSFFFCSAMLLSAFVRCDGNPQLAFWGMVAGAGSNIFLDWLFIFPFGWGIKGAAVASGLGQIFACAMLLSHFVRKKGFLHFTSRFAEKGLIREITLRGFPEFVSHMSQPVIIFCYNLLVIKLLGEIGVAAFSTVSYIVCLIVCTFFGVSQGVQPLISYSYGEKNVKSEKNFFRMGFVLNVFLAVFVNLLLLVAGKQIAGLFNPDPVMIQNAYDCMKVYDISFIFASVNIIFTTYYLATKRTAQSLTISVLRTFVLSSICIFSIPAIFGSEYIWTGIIVAEGIVMLIAICLKWHESKTRA